MIIMIINDNNDKNDNKYSFIWTVITVRAIWIHQ